MNELSIQILGAILKGILSVWYVWVFLLILLFSKFMFRLWELKRLAKSGINEIDEMDGKTFEKYLEVLFRNLGYKVERTRYVGDYGADLVVWQSGIKTVIQAKRYKKNVGVKAVQEAVAAKGYYVCDKAMVVSNSFYTKPAVNLAKANDVQLWDRDDLVKAILLVKGKKDQMVGQSNIDSKAYNELAVSMEDENSIDNICFICGELVSEKVRQYCITHTDRFSGKIYCFQHQKEVSRDKQ